MLGRRGGRSKGRGVYLHAVLRTSSGSINEIRGGGVKVPLKNLNFNLQNLEIGLSIIVVRAVKENTGLNGIVAKSSHLF